MPDKKPEFDLQSAHRYFAAECFNKTWGYIDKPDRTEEDNLAMLHTTMASLWHWSQREDVTPTNYSIGYWQVSRAYALLDQADNARRYAELCLKTSAGIEPEYAGFAYEALARAELAAGNRAKMNEYLAKAREYAEMVEDKEDREILERDLETLK